MSKTAFGLLLQCLREQRNLSLREFAELAKIDHAYIYRLETGEKNSPSDDALEKLIRALKSGKRESNMLRYLATRPETSNLLVKYVLNDPTVTLEEFTTASGIVFRGPKPDYSKLIEQIRRINKMMNEDNSNG